VEPVVEVEATVVAGAEVEVGAAVEVVASAVEAEVAVEVRIVVALAVVEVDSVVVPAVVEVDSAVVDALLLLLLMLFLPPVLVLPELAVALVELPRLQPRCTAAQQNFRLISDQSGAEEFDLIYPALQSNGSFALSALSSGLSSSSR